MSKSLFLTIGILLLTLHPTPSRGQNATAEQYPPTVASSYQVDASAPFFSAAKLWILFGGAPNKFTLYEHTWSDSGGKNFSMVLVDNGGSAWMELYSDTTQRSTVKLPADTIKTMGADGIKFVVALRQVFADSGNHYLTGRVTLAGILRYATATELKSSTPETRRFIIHVYDDDNTYVDGEVTINYKDCVITYGPIDVFVTQSKVRLKLTPLNTTEMIRPK